MTGTAVGAPAEAAVDVDFDIEDEKFRVQLHLVLKLLTFEWEANLELLAAKLQELCLKYLQHKAKVNGVVEAVVPVKVALDAVKSKGAAIVDAYTAIPVQVTDRADKTVREAVEAAKTRGNALVDAVGAAAIAQGNAVINAYVPTAVTEQADKTVLEAIDIAKAKGSAVVDAYVPVVVVDQADKAAKQAKRLMSRVMWASDIPDTKGERTEESEIEATSAADGNATNTPATEAEMAPEEVKVSRALVYDETINEDNCNLIITNPRFEDKLDAEGCRSWLTISLLTALSGVVPSEDPTQPLPELEGDSYGDFYYSTQLAEAPTIPSSGLGNKSLESRLYLRFIKSATTEPAVIDIGHLMRNTLYPSSKHVIKVVGYQGTQIVPAGSDFQDIWDQEILGDWYRGAALLWSAELLDASADSKDGDKSDSSGLVDAIGAVLPIGNASGLTKSALKIGEVAVEVLESDDDKKETIVEATVETKDKSNATIEAKVEAKVALKVTDVPETNGSADAGSSVIESTLESTIETVKEELTTKLVESTAAAIGKSEASILESAAAIGETEASLVQSALALGKSEPALPNSTPELLESKTALVESAVELAKSKDSLVQSAVALGKSKDSMLGTALKIADTLGESVGVDIIDTDNLDNGKDKKLTGWEKLKAEFPCPIDYPADTEYKAKFTLAVEDCIPSLVSAQASLSKILELHFAKSTPGYTPDAFRDRQVLNKLLIATHRLVVAFICSENMIRYVTGVEEVPLGDDLLDTGLDGVEAALNMMGPNPAAMVVGGVLKAGRGIVEQKKKDAAAKFQKGSTSILRKLWFLTTEVYAFLWFTRVAGSDGKYEFISTFHKANFKIIRENRVRVYEEDEQPPLELPEDYFMYLQEQTILLKDYTDELEAHAKEMLEGLDNII
ncbi:hypothetical protein H072_249 [Dactylellina haptotyla CBS 200.50]|uniref:Uncharacterized protein n=1 Tax=Dactylellina haptotyla (strain CBS 200.50) TaxID=1284197 RepID=S8ASM3_DACHA|nr:hypothetical protein H072_249 [Dactylellina haptotyla CBS 200.50]